jgi:hypothetical protein
MLAVPLAAQQAVVTKNVNLRPTHSTAHDPIRLLHPPEPLTLVVPNPIQGYYHVTTQLNENGWVWGKNITIGSPAPLVPDSPGPALPAAGSEIVLHAACPAVGTHQVNGVKKSYADTSDAGLRNMAKRHAPVGTTAVTLTLADLQSLQNTVSTSFADAHTSKTAFTPDRSALQSLGLGTGSVSEGDLVQLVGFVNAVRPEGAESVNCAGTDGGDIHISIGPQSGTEWQGVVVEMIPQLGHPIGWDSTTLAHLKAQQLRVLVVGGLTYDNEHLVNDDPAHPNGTQPKRVSLWEIHPVTEFYVCEQASCDPAHHAGWTTLSAWAKAHP